MKRDWILFGVIWVVLTVLFEVLVFVTNIFPGAYAREAHITDDAFVMMMAIGVPVFTFVIAMLAVAILRFRVPGDEPPTEDGPPIRRHQGVFLGWIAVTTTLCLVLIVNPGLVGLHEIRGSSSADHVIEVQGQRWSWTIGYPDAGVEVRDELVLPVDKRIRFDVTAPPADVVHSFWVPAFRTKMDAVPGRVTQIYITPERTGSFDTEPGLRLQCAELCGLGHSEMAVPVRVVTEDEFDAWLAEKAAEQAGDESDLAETEVTEDEEQPELED